MKPLHLAISPITKVTFQLMLQIFPYPRTNGSGKNQFCVKTRNVPKVTAVGFTPSLAVDYPPPTAPSDCYPYQVHASDVSPGVGPVGEVLSAAKAHPL